MFEGVKTINNNVKIHKGFHDLFLKIESKLTTEIQKQIDTNINQIVFCGSSLGAALFVLATWNFKQNNIIHGIAIRNITCGLPPVGNEDFIKQYTKNIVYKHFILYKDPISMLNFKTLKFTGITKWFGYHQMNTYHILNPIVFKLIHHSMNEYLWVYLNTLKNNTDKIKTLNKALNIAKQEYKRLQII